ncbi:MAG: hypothetical protein U1F43_29050 [Myxococcota bacterium]
MHRFFVALPAAAALLSVACDGVDSTPASAPARTSAAVRGHGPRGVEAGPVRSYERRWTRPPQRNDAHAFVATEAPAPTCESTMNAGWSAVEAARIDAAACDTNADCTLAQADTRCGGVDLFAVSFLGVARFQSAVDAIDADLCGALGPECPIIVADMANVTSACIAGRCEMAAPEPTCDPSSGRQTAEGCLTCDAASSKANGALQAAVAEYDACQVDSDCVRASDDTGCSSTCGVAINRANLDVWSEALSTIQADYCTGGDCPIAMAGCLPSDAKCEAGRCTLVGSW